jgi:hypothetical protein
MVRRRLLERRAFIYMQLSMATAISTVCALTHSKDWFGLP